MDGACETQPCPRSPRRSRYALAATTSTSLPLAATHRGSAGWVEALADPVLSWVSSNVLPLLQSNLRS